MYIFLFQCKPIPAPGSSPFLPLEEQIKAGPHFSLWYPVLLPELLFSDIPLTPAVSLRRESPSLFSRQ